ncbi:MAG: ATPase, T2SS/T4P/T4SS family [Planctomycetia bacterium]|nr:ATPase, T2SS/T4P/T4SS family [Planctomycetia bacterium]
MNRSLIIRGILVILLTLGWGWGGRTWQTVGGLSVVYSQEEDAAEEDVATEEDAAAEGEEGEEWEYEEEAPAGSEFNASRDMGRGGYVALWKVLFVVLIYLAWVFSTDWLSTDCQKYKLGVAKWVPIAYGAFLGSLLLFWLLPWFWLGILLVLAAYVAPLAVYIRQRNENLSYGEQVLTLPHLRFLLSEILGRVGVKFAAQAKDKLETGFPVLLRTTGENKAECEQWRIQARAHEGFNKAREVLSTAMENRPDAIMYEFGSTTVAVRYQIDGVWNPGVPFARELGDPALEALKLLCGLDPKNRRTRQDGKFALKYEFMYTFPEDRLKIKRCKEELEAVPEDELAQQKEKQRELQIAQESARKPVKRTRDLTVKLTSQGTPTGEKVLLQFEGERAKLETLDSTGMPAEMQAMLKQHLACKQGFFLFSAPPANGLRTITAAALKKTDRYVREFFEIEGAGSKYEEIENVNMCVCEAKDVDGWREYVRSIFLKDPNVVVCRDIPFPEVMNDMLQEVAEEERLIITTIRAKDAAEALLRIMATKCDAKKWIKEVQGVLCQRLVRKLCGHCKESYAPSAQLVQQLGLPAGRYKFYRPPQAPKEEDEKCKECLGLGYSGRTAIFELVKVGDATRQALATQPQLEAVRKALRKDGNKTLMEEGFRLIVSGDTSLAELKRVLT